MMAGFGLYGLTTGQTNFYVRYRIVVGNNSGEEIEKEIQSSEVDEQTKIFQVMLDGDLTEVPAGVDVTIVMRMFGAGNNYRVRGYYGNSGNSYKSFDN